MTSPWERLREAAEMVLPYLPVGGTHGLVPAFAFAELRKGLADLPATSTQAVASPALREAVEDFVEAHDEHGWSFDVESYIEPIREALAALPATPPEQPVPDAKVADLLAENAKLRAEIGALESRVPDAERERAIGAIRDRLYRALENGEATGEVWISTAHRNLIDDVVALLRSAPAPKPMDGELEATRAALDRLKLELDEAHIFLGTRGVGSGLMLERVKELYRVREAVAALETVATKRQNVDLRDAAHRILNDYSPCMNCGTWSRETEGHSPCNPVSVPATQTAEKPAPPASDWRERFVDARIDMIPHFAKSHDAMFVALHDGLVEAHAALAETRARLDAIERKEMP